MIRVKSQKGSTLVVSMILLALITIVGISSVNISQFEESMTANYRQRQIAFQIAEAGLSMAESIVDHKLKEILKDKAKGVDDLESSFFLECDGGYCLTRNRKSDGVAGHDCERPAGSIQKPWEQGNVWTDDTKVYSLSVGLNGIDYPVRVLYEWRCFVPKNLANHPDISNPEYHNMVHWAPNIRTTVLAIGPSDSMVMLQSSKKIEVDI
tara:strand:+ start:4571 stop:5197 length:627 start_codon:yes stop_codon:yes gene_type:complete